MYATYLVPKHRGHIHREIDYLIGTSQVLRRGTMPA